MSRQRLFVGRLNTDTGVMEEQEVTAERVGIRYGDAEGSTIYLECGANHGEVTLETGDRRLTMEPRFPRSVTVRSHYV